MELEGLAGYPGREVPSEQGRADRQGWEVERGFGQVEPVAGLRAYRRQKVGD